MNVGNLFLLMASVTSLLLSVNCSWTNVLNWASQSRQHSTQCLCWSLRLLFSLKGFPKCLTQRSRHLSRMQLVSLVFVHDVDTLCWCLIFKFHATSGLPTIHRPNTAEIFVSPTAPPSPWTSEFSCSWAWSRAMDENGLSVLCITNEPSQNVWNTSRCWRGSSHMSRMCTESLLA